MFHYTILRGTCWVRMNDCILICFKLFQSFVCNYISLMQCVSWWLYECLSILLLFWMYKRLLSFYKLHVTLPVLPLMNANITVVWRFVVCYIIDIPKKPDASAVSERRSKQDRHGLSFRRTSLNCTHHIEMPAQKMSSPN